MQCINKIALVTGAASGLGAATAKMLASKGFKVACCDRSFVHSSPSPSLVDSMQSGSNIMFCGMDPLSTNDISTVLDTIKTAYGHAPCVLINTEQMINGEDIISRTLTPHSLDSFQEVINRNVVGYFNVIRLAVKEMLGNPRTGDGERGVIINTSSISAMGATGAMIAYSTAMAAIAGMTLPLARSLGRYGIRCVGVQPGLFNTPEIKDYEDTVNVMSKMTPFPRRLGEPEEFASVVETIINNIMINGCNMRLDGGIRSYWCLFDQSIFLL